MFVSSLLRSLGNTKTEVLTMLQSLLRLLSNEEEDSLAVEQLDVSFESGLGLCFVKKFTNFGLSPNSHIFPDL